MSDRDMDDIKTGKGIPKEVPSVDPDRKNAEKQAGLRRAEGNDSNEISSEMVEKLKTKLRRQITLEKKSELNGLTVVLRSRRSLEPKKTGLKAGLRTNKTVKRRPKKNKIGG